MHLVDELEVTHVLVAPLWKELLSKKVDQVLDILIVGEINVLPWV